MTEAQKQLIPVDQPSTVMTPMAMIDRAIASGAGVETLERLMALQERFEASEARKAYDAAMHAAQAEMRPVAADASNPQTKSRYASYEALDSAIRPIYTNHGFSLSFDTADGAPADHVRIVCEVACHGHRAHKHIDMPADGKGAKGGDVMTKTHAMGSAVSYGRRYLLGMIFNITIAKDDDGNAAARPSPPKLIDAEQFSYVRELIEKTGSDEAKLLAWLKAEDLHTLTQPQYQVAIAALKKKQKKAGK